MRTSAYTPNFDTDDFLNDAPIRAAGPQTISSGKTVNSPEGGVFDGQDLTFPTVATGAVINSLIIYNNTGTESTSDLIAHVDGFSVTPNNGDITVQWDNTGPNRIFKL